MTNLTPKNISRRSMLQIIGVGTASALLASCAPSPAETTEPTEAEAPKMATGPLTVLLCCGTEDTHQLQEKFNKYFDTTYGGMKSDLQLTLLVRIILKNFKRYLLPALHQMYSICGRVMWLHMPQMAPYWR